MLNLQIVIQKDGVYMSLFSETYAQHMDLEGGNYDCFDEVKGWFKSPIPCDGVIITPDEDYVECPWCYQEFSTREFADHENICPKRPGAGEDDPFHANSENNGDIGGGGYGGGTTTGGSGSSCGSGNGPNTNLGSHHVGTQKLIEAINKAVSSIPGTGKACNLGVQAAFKNAFGSLPSKMNCMANQMVKYWQSSPSWKRISIDEATYYAAKGYFVVAGWINPTGNSGHVVVIVPNGTTYKSNWGGTYRQVPSCMDTGPNRRTTSQSISQSFGKDKRDNVVFFVYY